MTLPRLAAVSRSSGMLILLAVGLLAHGVVAAWQHWNRRAPLPVWSVPATAAAPVVAPALNAQALEMLFGLAPAQAPLASAAALVLRASIVGAAGQSRALVASGANEQFYREGERLPDGSVLRGIQADRVLLWRNGRVESLALLRPAVQHFTLATQPAAGRAAPASSWLRPLSGPEARK